VEEIMSSLLKIIHCKTIYLEILPLFMDFKKEKYLKYAIQYLKKAEE
jgi:hypothetical protein